MHKGEEVVGKTAIFYKGEVVNKLTRVMVVKWLGEDRYILSDFDNPETSYEAIGWDFTLEKEHDQPTEPDYGKYLEAYERR